MKQKIYKMPVYQTLATKRYFLAMVVVGIFVFVFPPLLFIASILQIPLIMKSVSPDSDQLF